VASVVYFIFEFWEENPLVWSGFASECQNVAIPCIPFQYGITYLTVILTSAKAMTKHSLSNQFE